MSLSFPFFAATRLWLDLCLTPWCHACHIFTSINEPLSYSGCSLSHGESESVKGESQNSQDQEEEEATETPLTSNGHLMQPTEGGFQQL